MAVIQAWLRCRRLDSDAVYATSAASDIADWQIDRILDAPARIHLELPLLSTFATALVNATGGPDCTQPIIPLFCEFSLDGGASIDLRFVLVSAQRSLDPAKPMLVIDQDDQSVLYSVSGTDRVTYVNVSPILALYGGAGASFPNTPGPIPRPIGSIGRASLPFWPETKGYYRNTLGKASWAGKARLLMQPVVDPAISAEPLSQDINADTTWNTTKSAVTRMAGIYRPTDAAPPGARAHVVPMTGDAARNPLGIKQAMSIGRVPLNPALTFTGDGQGSWNEAVAARFSGTGLAVNPVLSEMFSQISADGGISNHGISTGEGTSGAAATKITALITVNHPVSGLSTKWDDNLLLVGTSDGVRYHVVGSGLLIPMSPVVYVTAMALNDLTHTLYIATPHGVFSMSATPPPFAGSGSALLPLSRVGGITFAVEDLWLDSTGYLFIRVGGSQKWQGASVDGVYSFPTLGGDTSGDTQGYAGWSRLIHSSAIRAAGGNLNDIYYTDNNKADTVYHIHPGSTTKPVPAKVQAGQSVIGIDTVFTAEYQRVYVRTDAGDKGLYSIQAGLDVLQRANNDGSLQSSDGAAVQIRRVWPSGITMQGEYIYAFAATNAGLFRTMDPAGNGWSAPNAISGLGDFDIAMATAGTDQTVLGQSVSRIFTGGERTLLVSCDAGDSWRNLLADKLDGGPAWYARAIAWGGGWPDNDIGALGTLAGAAAVVRGSAGSVLGNLRQGSPAAGNLSVSGADTGGTGRVLGPPAGAVKGPLRKGVLPAGYIRARRLDEQRQFTFRMVNLTSTAPQAGMQWDEFSELQANANVGAITASEQLELVEFRWLQAVAAPRFQLPLASSMTQTNAALRDLQPTDVVTVQYNPAGYTSAMAFNSNLYVISHSLRGTGGVVRTQTVVSNTLETQAFDAHAMAASLQDRLTKKLRWGSA